MAECELTFAQGLVMQFQSVEQLAAHLERAPHIRGKLVADVPELAGLRLKYRRGFYRWVSIHFASGHFQHLAGDIATGRLVVDQCAVRWPVRLHDDLQRAASARADAAAASTSL